VLESQEQPAKFPRQSREIRLAPSQAGYHHSADYLAAAQ